MHFPGFSAAAVEFLVHDRQVSALGIDTLSIDPGNSRNFAAHKFGLGHGLYFMENLTNLEELPVRGATLFCGPLKITNGTGSPARVLAVTSERGK
jgi:kynurenine formamidase